MRNITSDKLPFLHITEIICSLDYYSGEIYLDGAVAIIANKYKCYIYDNHLTDELRETEELIDKIIDAINFTCMVHGKVRDYHIFLVPAFATPNPTGDSQFVIAVKADNNGTTLVFSDFPIVHFQNVSGRYKYIGGGYGYEEAK